MGNEYSQSSTPFRVLKLPSDPCSHASSPTKCLFSIGHSLHPHIGCFSLAMVYTHTMLVFHWSQLTPMHCLILVITLLILSTAGCICLQHPLGSSQVKVIYNISLTTFIDYVLISDFYWLLLIAPSTTKDMYLRLWYSLDILRTDPDGLLNVRIWGSHFCI